MRLLSALLLLVSLASCAAPREEMPRLPSDTAPPAAREAPPGAAHREAPAQADEEPEVDLVALRFRLHRAASQAHRPLTYDEVWTALEHTDEDPDDPANVILLYTGRSHPKTDKDSTSRNPGTPTNQSWNREHVWPRSHGLEDDDELAHNDLHHLRPVDRTVNSSRGNKDFDDGGTPHHEASGSSADADSFEPRDAVKGDIARMLFYMDVRYENALDGNDLELVDRTTEGEAVRLGRLCALLLWHHLDPVDGSEERRHARVVELQGNHNPFISEPALAELLYGSRCPAAPVS